MTILFGHPTGNPNSFHAALAHFEAGRLEALCIPWMPSALTLQALDRIPALRPLSARLARRHFAALARAPKVQGKAREWARLLRRLLGVGEDRLVHDANDWLMRIMRRECQRPAVTAAHAYEDCALWPFEEAKRLGKACIYDMPTVFFRAWQPAQADLVRKYAHWLPATVSSSAATARIGQKRKEMELADIVLAPSRFATGTIREFYPAKKVVVAPYGADTEFWTPPIEPRPSGRLRFIFAGQISIRKGIPGLIEAWEKAALRDAELELVGSWHLKDALRMSLPVGIVHRPPCAPVALRERYRAADVLVFPSFFEGFGLVVVEGMACGLPALASDTTVAPEIVTPASGRIVPAGNTEAMVEALRWFGAHRGDLPAMRQAAREQAELCTWDRYRRLVTQAVTPYS